MKRYIMSAIVMLVVLLSSSWPALASSYGELEQQLQELTKRVEVLESWFVEQATDSFTGQGSSQTMPFTITESPWTISWRTESTMMARPPFWINVCTANTSTCMGSYGGAISENTTTGRTVSYIPAGTYYFSVNSDYWISWTISID